MPDSWLNRRPSAKSRFRLSFLVSGGVLLGHVGSNNLGCATVRFASKSFVTDGVDVALDTFHYNGTTTTCEALWMGVPVVSITGDRHAARVGLSLLTALGHAEWAAENEDAYIEKAVTLAQDRALRSQLRDSLRSEVAASILCDHAGQANRFEVALRQAWTAWCS